MDAMWLKCVLSSSETTVYVSFAELDHDIIRTKYSFDTVRRSNRSPNSPRASGLTPYTAQQSQLMSSPTPSIVEMAQAMITTIQTSTDGVQTEIVSMTRAMT
eukprot:2369640-Amphidinium_carterae.1